jgi:anti-sigma factor RsiW
MNHEQAMKDQATERYLLGELPENERDAFEEHYFECEMCADEVKSAFAFKDAVRASRTVHDEVAARRVARKAKWNLAPPLAAAASVLMAMLAWMQFGVVGPLRTAIATSKQPAIGEEYTLREVRGAEERAVNNSHIPATLNVDVVTDDKSPQYNFVILDGSGRARFTIPVPGNRAREGVVPVILPPGTLEPGSYTLRVDGTEAGVAKLHFTVR